MLFNGDGFPCVWAILAAGFVRDHSAPLKLLFVSDSLEQAAAKAFGPPLPGRRYSIERDVGDAPTTVVPRIVEDGPIPMGPYVYLAADTHALTTLLCRCEPSQARSFIETDYYDLQDLADLGTWGRPWRDWGNVLFQIQDHLRWPREGGP